MAQQVVAQLNGTLPQMTWPGEGRATPVGRQTYLEGIRRADTYIDQSDPHPLAEALRIFRSGDSAPYAMAGAAYVLIAASRSADGAHDPAGLQAALSWLEKAQADEPDLLDINVLEGFIYIYEGRFDDARLVLDYLTERDPYHFMLTWAEVAYWEEQGDAARAEQWYEQALAAAPEHRDRLRLQNRLADLYARTEQHEKAIAAYRQGLAAQQQDAHLWHKLSLVYWKLADYAEARRCNERSLVNGNLPAAQEMATALQAQAEDAKGRSGLLGRLGF
jgi:tetratricopeptide (TPR) repeat protein